MVIYDSLGVPVGGLMDVEFVVYFEGDVGVPAGDFHCFGIGTPMPSRAIVDPVSKAVCDIYGALIEAQGGSPSSGEASEWYADGVGLVQRYMWGSTPDYMMTLRWHNLPTPTVATTWGSLKSRFLPAGEVWRREASR